MEATSAISQEQLVAALQRRGYETVNIRQVIDWRARGLLPPFDVLGSGLGRSQGREASKWSSSENLLEQSAWIIELLNLYGTYNRLYVPLWLLGYPVPYDRIREALSQPLTRTLRDVERECDSECNMEDALSDAAHRLAARLERQEPIFHMSPDAIELILNVFINPEYDLTDEGAFQAWQIWQQHCAEQQRRLSNDAAATTSAVDSLDSLMSQAMIAKQYLSVAAIKNVVDESTSDDLRIVERDLEILRRIAQMFAKLLRRELPATLQLPRDGVWRIVFVIGRIAICLDLSLRKHGFGRDIDRLLVECAEKVEIAFNQKFGDRSKAATAGSLA